MENPFELILQRLDAIERLLNELKTGRSEPTNQMQGSYDLMNVQQVAAYLSLSVQTIYGLVYKREIPNAKRGKRLYFNRGEIDEWIGKSRRKTMAEIEAEAANYIVKNPRRRW